MEFCALASGSSGNCFYVKRKDTAVLIDCGISCKQVMQRLSDIGQSPENINGIFVTHEHTDHIRGIDVLARKFNIPIYITKKTAGSCHICSSMHLVNPISNNESIQVDGLTIEPFSKPHDALDPVSYSIESKESRIAVITDIGHASRKVIDHISAADSIIFESNHDYEMLHNGSYPQYLKNRIASHVGHLSNYDSAMAILQHASPRLKHLILSHLSINNNTPEIALDTFKLIKERKDLNPSIHLSTRESPSEYIGLK